MKTIVIFDFMIKDLKLKGSELLVYALIYSFSQFGQSCYMKCDKMARVIGLSRSQIFRALSSLTKKNYISYVNGYFCNNTEFFNQKVADDLKEAIRIAKTPWVK